MAKRNVILTIRRAPFAVLVAAWLAPAGAAPPARPDVDESRSWMPFVYGGAGYDSNVFRVRDEDEAQAQLGTDRMSDSWWRTGVGIDSRIRQSLQTFRLSGWLEYTDFQHFDDLDHTAGALGGDWDWEVGRLWSGNVHAGWKQTLAGFEQSQLVDKDKKQTGDVSADATLAVTPDWDVSAGLSQRLVNFTQRDVLDRTEHGAFGEAVYRSPVGTHVGLRMEWQQGEFDREEMVAGDLLSNDYDEVRYLLVAGYDASGKSRLVTRWGWVERSHDERDERDFSGATARADYLWDVSGKTDLRLTAWRETTSLAEELTTYVDSRGVALAPAWQVTAKTRFYGRLAGESQRYEAQLGSDREDDIYSLRLGVDYELLRQLHVSVEAETEERESNQDTYDYQYTSIFAGLGMAF